MGSKDGDDQRIRNEAEILAQHAAVYLEVAHEHVDHGGDRLPLAFDDARQAAELAGKALLLVATGSHPDKHAIGGVLYQQGLLPAQLEPRRVHRLLTMHTDGRYLVRQSYPPPLIEEMLALARALIDAFHGWPEGRYHAPTDADRL